MKNSLDYRKEFFKVTTEEIERSCIELGYKVQITKLATASDYRKTLEIEESEILKKAV